MWGWGLQENEDARHEMIGGGEWAEMFAVGHEVVGQDREFEEKIEEIGEQGGRWADWREEVEDTVCCCVYAVR